jgi:hypothetical protein
MAAVWWPQRSIQSACTARSTSTLLGASLSVCFSKTKIKVKRLSQSVHVPQYEKAFHQKYMIKYAKHIFSCFAF